MAAIARSRILPMKTAGTQHFIERTYREGGTFQWVREAYKNSQEAAATKVRFGIEWQAVENLGVYRRVIADDGIGMDADELVAFFNTFGGGGKPIGEAHENFGIGVKTSLLPWNRHGIVVVSWVDGEASMIWVQRDAETGEYGLRLFDIEEDGEISIESVVTPFEDEEHGCDWSQVKPEWLHEHGTVLVLLGNGPSDNTVLGDPNREESAIKGISAYLNKRLWTLPDGMVLTVDELRTQDRSNWPPSEEVAHKSQANPELDRRTNMRTVMGAKNFIDYPRKLEGGQLANSGTQRLRDGTEIDWFLWEGNRPTGLDSYAAAAGYIAALYQGELYDVTSHHATYRSFGVSESAVRQNLWLIVRPPQFEEGTRFGVYPKTDRNSLLLRGGPNPGGPLPINEWGNEFADSMPEAIHNAIVKVRAGAGGGTLEDPTWRARLMARFGARWRVMMRRVHPNGVLGVTPDQAGSDPVRRGPRKVKRRRKPRNGTARVKTGLGGALILGQENGDKPAEDARVGGGLPSYRRVPGTDFEPGMLAVWKPKDDENPAGVVLLNIDHPVLRQVVEHWQAQFPEHYSEEIFQDVTGVYGEVAVSKVAHSAAMRSIIPVDVIEEKLRSPEALTMALLGLLAEEAVIAPRIGGKYKRRRPEAVGNWENP